MLTIEQVQAKIETSCCVSVRNAKNTAFFDLGCDEIDDKGQVEMYLKGSSEARFVHWTFLAADNVTFYKLQEN